MDPTEQAPDGASYDQNFKVPDGAGDTEGSNLLGTKELKEAIKLIVESAESVPKIIGNGFQFSDIQHIKDVIDAAPEAFRGSSQIWPEVKDLTKDEVIDIHQFIVDEFDFDASSAIGVLVERILAVTKDVYLLVEAIKDCRGLREM